MKKVGIMSMHRIYNYGSFLQGYSLKKMIEDVDSNIEVTFIDYNPGEVLVKDTIAHSSRIQRVIDKLREYNKVKAKFRDKIKFFNHKRTYAKRFFPMLGLSPKLNNDTQLDVEVIGSDEVFNAVQSNTNVGYSRDLFGYKSKAKKVISYAGSFGNTTIEKIDEFKIRNNLVDDFSQFSKISVRDQNSKNIIKELIGKDPDLNVDPVLAYDLMKLEPKIPNSRMCKGKYIIVYGYSGRLTHQENEAVKKYAKSIDAKVLCIGGVQECCDEFIDCTPFELLAYFRDAEAIITDTFHGTIFSIINNRPFGTLIRKSAGLEYGNEEKLAFLLKTFGLYSQIIDNSSNIENILSKEINWISVNIKLEKERMCSKKYLSDNL